MEEGATRGAKRIAVAAVVDEARQPKRQRKSTTVMIDSGIAGVGMVPVLREQLDTEARLTSQENAHRAAREAKELSRKVLEHEAVCAHCRRSIHAQSVVVDGSVSAGVGGRWKLQLENGQRSQVRLCVNCPRAYHARCLALYSAGKSGGLHASMLSCPQHRCAGCHRGPTDSGGLLFRCVDCTRAMCFDCGERAGLLQELQHVRACPAFERLGFLPPRCYEYVRCADCSRSAGV